MYAKLIKPSSLEFTLLKPCQLFSTHPPTSDPYRRPLLYRLTRSDAGGQRAAANLQSAPLRKTEWNRSGGLPDLRPQPHRRSPDQPDRITTALEHPAPRPLQLQPTNTLTVVFTLIHRGYDLVPTLRVASGQYGLQSTLTLTELSLNDLGFAITAQTDKRLPRWLV